ncbi:MAG: hypothetical protein EON58_10330 [Alphaproteobacteria bacterium]|nr:MAG: hypothetical protein EON58_10330 [Alphaproteobacteria bacterium]
MSGRPEFRDWIDRKPEASEGPLPLTHVTKGITAQDVIRDGAIKATECPVFKRSLAYLFYGRPAYRVGGDGPIRRASSSPFCFIFSPELIERAEAVYAFDTGAYAARMYKHSIMEEMKPADFALEVSLNQPAKLVECVFGSSENYFDGRPIGASEEEIAEWEFLAQAYVSLVTSTGRNEPDDRVGSIEAVFSKDIDIAGNLLAVVVPHTVWDEGEKAPWLSRLSERGVEVLPYHFMPGRTPDYYYAFLETEVRRFYKAHGHLK